MTHRTPQIASTIQRVVQTLLTRGLNDPRIRGLVSVTQVRVSDDLADAVVFVSVLPAEHAKLTVHGLQHAAGMVQSQVAQALQSRRTPKLSFRLDDSLKRQAALDAALASIHPETDSAIGADSTTPSEGDDRP